MKTKERRTQMGEKVVEELKAALGYNTHFQA